MTGAARSRRRKPSRAGNPFLCLSGAAFSPRRRHMVEYRTGKSGEKEGACARMKIYTRTGDGGKTGVIGARVDKDHVRVEAIGTIDELNSFVGVAAALAGQSGRCRDLAEQLALIQHELFDCGSDLAVVRKDGAARNAEYKVKAELTSRLEAWIDAFDAETEPIRRFILPGGDLLAAELHVCRTVCRRAERRVVTLAKTEEINPEARRYLNRLSDYFFAAARAANARAGVADVEYARGADVFSRE